MIYGDLKPKFWTPLGVTGGVFLLIGYLGGTGGCAILWVLAVLALGVGLMLRGFPGLRSCWGW